MTTADPNSPASASSMHATPTESDTSSNNQDQIKEENEENSTQQSTQAKDEPEIKEKKVTF